MKILYHHRVFAQDGQDVHITEIIAAMRRQGHQVVVVAPRWTEAKSSNPGRLGRIRAALPAWLYELLELGYSLIAFAQLLAAWRTEKPDLLYERYNLFCWSGVWLHRLTAVPYMLEVNAPLAWERARHGGLALRRLAAWSESRVWRAATLTLPVTQVLATRLRAAGVAQERILVLANGVDRRKFFGIGENPALRQQLGLTGKLVLGFTGYVRDWHGLPLVIDAMARFEARQDLHFLVVGDGPGLAELQAYAASKAMSARLTCLGVVPRDRIIGLTQCFDIALQPQVVDYASPLKLLEYMALGRAILAPDQANIRELLSHDHNALLFDPGQPEQFIAMLGRLIADSALRHRLAAAASATIEAKRLTWDDNVLRLIAALTARPSSTTAPRGSAE